MTTRDPGLTYCNRSGCRANFKPGHWENSRAQKDGWFTQKNGDAWCRRHHPSWVAAWRDKKRNQA